MPRGYRVFLGILVLVWFFSGSAVRSQPRFFFLFIGDGMGENDVRLLERYRSSQGSPSSFSALSSVGTISTLSLGEVPDSASSGTALACGVKTRNGMIGLDPFGKAVPSLAEIARKRGLRVGIITNVAINDATPASFYAHRLSRRDYPGIARDMVESGFDLLVGWGIASPGEALSLAQSRGYTVFRNWEDFLSRRDLPVIALLSFPFCIDQKGKGYALRDAVRRGIELLYNPQGFFLLVEGGKIDWCKHMNDVGSLLFEMLDFDEAIGEALDFAQRYPRETVILVTADHETGGLELGANLDLLRVYSQPFSYQIFLDRCSSGETPLKLARVMWRFEEEAIRQLTVPHDSSGKAFVALAREFAREVGVSWKTTSHTGTSVPVFLWEHNGPSESWQDNTDVFRFFQRFLEE
ncbi:MAG: alkaline phosphatase [Candidatus Caldatribacteriaceae bacterium]